MRLFSVAMLFAPTVVLLFANLTSDVYAQWLPDGAEVCTEVGDQHYPRIVGDGAGGAFITWDDRRGGTDYDVYVQRLDESGLAQWTADGVAICTETGDQFYPMLVSDGTGGVIVTWMDARTGSGEDIYAQRVDASGTVLWATNGVALCTANGSQQYPKLVQDGAGGAIVAWQDLRTGQYLRIYAQRVNASGTALWTTDGVALCTAIGDRLMPRLAPDGAGGAIVTWEDHRFFNNYDIYAQRVTASGTPLWTTDGVALCAATGGQGGPEAIPDGAGGAIVTWWDYRSGVHDIYAQRVNASGVPQWTANGVAVCAATSYQLYPTITSDGAGGAIVTWQDYRSGDYDIYAQRVDASGGPQWAANGVAICTQTAYQQLPTIASDYAGGAIVTWYDARSGPDDIYAQRVDASGTPLWMTDGLDLCLAPGVQKFPFIASDGSGGAVVAWQDGRSGNDDIYAQRVRAGGYRVGPPAPITPVSIAVIGFALAIFAVRRLRAIEHGRRNRCPRSYFDRSDLVSSRLR